MPRPAAPPAAVDPRKAAQAQQDLAMAGLGDFDLPRTTVTRLARSQVGDSAKLSQDVISALIKSSTVFINYLGRSAHDHADSSGRKTVAYQDVFQALSMIQYGGSDEGVALMEEVLTDEINAWDAIQKQAKNKPPGESSRGRNNFKSKSASGSGLGDASNGNGNGDGDENGDGDQDEEEEEEEEQQEEQEEEEGMDLDKERDGAVRSRPVEADQGDAAAGIDQAEAAEKGNVAPSRGATEDGDDVTMASEPED
ncbi:hypothetical protein FFLO_00979 [Filobasidium floriforme]|uniref:DNA polymerase epsilon subunit D n=1 Tax=Filobasidium floriforme TaxID=5210 RepID=A0A8K0NQE0_9TREE|nr:hypothetical protein FFLO_00979 [Filobasidium floriforme]